MVVVIVINIIIKKMSIEIPLRLTLVLLLISPSVRCDSDSIIDLSHPLNSGTLHWLDARDFELKVTQNGTIRKGDHSYWVQQDEIHLGTHTGTHLDAPCHFARGKWSVADIPLKNFIDRPAAVIDIVQQSLAIRDYELSVEDIKEWEKVNNEISDGAVVLVRTGWSRFWPKKLEYFGTDTKDLSLLHFPGVHPAAAEWLIENRKIVGIGIDGPSIDNGQSPQTKSHQLFAAKNIYHLENIAQTIHKLPAIGAKLTLLPLKIEGASGVPVTVIAKIDSSETSSVNPTAHSLTALIISLMISFITFKFIFS